MSSGESGFVVCAIPCTTAVPPGGGSVVTPALAEARTQPRSTSTARAVGEAERREHVDTHVVVLHLVAEHRLVGAVEGAARLDPAAVVGTGRFRGHVGRRRRVGRLLAYLDLVLVRVAVELPDPEEDEESGHEERQHVPVDPPPLEELHGVRT